MSKESIPSVKSARGFLTSLVRDVRANTLIIMTAAMIPLAGMVGGGLDISRMYILKTRLQHACDAGALAGRKAMGGGTWTHTSGYPGQQANKFFDANFDWNSSSRKGQFASYEIERQFTESAGKVTGTVEAKIPMTLMRIFGFNYETLPVTCDAEMRLPNTDVMFVLDTTGSMGDTPTGDSMTKMASLKVAVKCFYEIVARLDTNATCTTGVPGGGTGNQVQIRFGFVPYATNANVGRLLPTNYFADSWPYQSRKANLTNTTSWVQQGPSTVTTNPVTQTGVPQSSCNDAAAAAAGYNSNTDTYSGPSNNTKTNTNVMTRVTGWTSASGGTCSGTQTRTVTVYKWQSTPTAFASWDYDKMPKDISGLKNGTTWNTSFSLPIGPSGTAKTIRWDGCIEERKTERLTDYDPIPAGAKDLNIDLVPTSSDPESLWAPVLPDIIYTRQRTSGGGSWNRTPVLGTTAEYINNSYYACPVEARKLQMWPVASQFDTYVDSLNPEGNTYHDIGLIWGARLASPTGIFASENAFTPLGGEIERHIIFMTDGDACTGTDNYTAYGIGWFDRRQTPDSTVPTAGCISNSFTLTEQVNRRTEAMCAAIKNKNFTLWVIAFGDLSTSTEDRLAACATPGRYFKATNAATLQATFKSIADQISMLRLTK